jgi:hypothetical protein
MIIEYSNKPILTNCSFLGGEPGRSLLERRNEMSKKLLIIKKWTGLLYTIIRAVILVLELLKHFK